jgi:hypothetical protein
MVTAWSFASAFGPLYIARMRETTGNYATGAAGDRRIDGGLDSVANHRPPTASSGFG